MKTDSSLEHIRNFKRGPYRLELFDLQRRGHDGKWCLAYRLSLDIGNEENIIFAGADFRCSPLDAVDSDATVAGLLTFLALRPGDTDREYFEDYTPAQLDFADHYGEELSLFALELEERGRTEEEQDEEDLSSES